MILKLRIINILIKLIFQDKYIFPKNPAFISGLQDQVKGIIKTKIKPKHLLPLKAKIPDLLKQQEINSHFDIIENKLEELSNEIGCQSIYLTKLRQANLKETSK